MSKIALITGGNRGLGRATALALIDAGIEVIYTHRGDPGEKIDAVALPLNVGDIESYDEFVTTLRQVLTDRHDRTDVDFLINNAGVGRAGSIAETPVEAFDEMLDVHFRGVFFLTQKLLPLIADGGRILNFSTGLARFTGDGYAAYASMKGAVEVFTRYLAKEVAPRGITANVVAPGPVATEFGGQLTLRSAIRRISMSCSMAVSLAILESRSSEPVLKSSRTMVRAPRWCSVIIATNRRSKSAPRAAVSSATAVVDCMPGIVA
jgi:NAD(P)-dependent dehydrogenase (short-subunit alcohol dehydrogenase family)